MPLSRLSAIPLVLALALAGCALSPAEAPASAPPLGPAVRISGAGTVLPLVQQLAEAYAREHPELRFHIEAGTNATSAIWGLWHGTLDLVAASRPLTDAEAAEGLEYKPFARDAFVLAAHLPDPAPGLSTAQVAAIYGGSVTDWQQVGGPPGPIIVLDRDGDNVGRGLGLSPLLNEQPIRARTAVLSTARDMVLALQLTPNSLGYSTLGLLHEAQPRDVRIVPLDGIMPDREAMARGTYPWHLTFALVHRADAPVALRQFLDFVHGPAGRVVVEAAGYAALER